MKVIIAGSRGIDDYKQVLQAIQESKFEITEVVSGRAKGVDLLGERYAHDQEPELPVAPFDCKEVHPLVRNIQMAKYAEALIAVWDGQSRGTKHMIDQAKLHGLQVFVFLVTQ